MTILHWLIKQRAKLRYGGEMGEVAASDRKVPTQAFNNMIRREEVVKVSSNAQARHLFIKPSNAALVFLPGFSAIPQLKPPGFIGEAAREHDANFVRFYHPDLIENPARVTYGRMIEDATAVVTSLEQEKVILVGSSFGAGLLPYVAQAVNAQQPGKVRAMFGWSAVPPQALMDAFHDQAGYDAFAVGLSSQFNAHLPTMPQPFPVTREAHESVKRFASVPTIPFDGHMELLTGQKDPLGRLCYALEMIAMCQGDGARNVVYYHDQGHSMDTNIVKERLSGVLKLVL